MNDAEHAAFLANRPAGVGSSDAPILAGVGWISPADLYRQKVGEVEPRPARGRLKRGLVLEPLVAAEYAERAGVPELTKAQTCVHPARPWQFCSPDYYAADGRMVELKTTAGFGDDWGDAGTDHVPDAYRVQCQHQMGVRGDPRMDLAALDVIGWELRVYRLEFHPDFFDWLTHDVEAPFWRRVEARDPVPAGWGDAFAERAMRPPEPGSVALIDVGYQDLFDRRKELKAITREAEVEAKAIDQTILALLGDGERAEVGPYRIKRVFVAGGHVEYDREPYWRLDFRSTRERKALP